MNKKLLSLVLSLVMVLGTFTSVFASSEPAKTADNKDAAKTETKTDDKKSEEVKKIVGKDNKIQYIIDKKFVEGYGNGDYGYDKNIKRSEITKLLVYANGNEKLAKELQGTMKLYKDVDTSFWANGVITVGTTVPSNANGLAMLNGFPNGDFKPEENVTYAQLSKMLVVLVKKDLTADMLKDANKHWAGQWMTWAAQLGILNDVTVKDSNAAATRADAFTMVYNALYTMKNFRMENTEAKLGILSNLNNNKLTLNQDDKQVYTVTENTVYVQKVVDRKQEKSNVIKVNAIKNPSFYLGTLVRVMVNDKNEVTHIIELGNPEDGALGTPAPKDNKLWDGVADKTASTSMYKVGSLNNLYYKDGNIYTDKAYTKILDAKYIATIGYSKDNTEIKNITVNGYKAEINKDTKVFVANPAQNIMKQVDDIYAALRLIGFTDKAVRVPNVYMGFDLDKRNTATNTFSDRTAKVVVFNLVTKDNIESTTYRVNEASRSNGSFTLVDSEGNVKTENNFDSKYRFPFASFNKMDLVEYSYDVVLGTMKWTTKLDASDYKKNPVVEVVAYDKDKNFLTVKDFRGNQAVLNIKDATIFTAKQKLEKGVQVQFTLDNNKVNANTVDLLNIYPENIAFTDTGILRPEVINGIQVKDGILAKLVSVKKDPSANASVITVNVYNTLTNNYDTTTKDYVVLTTEDAAALKDYVLGNKDLLIRFTLNKDNKATNFVVVNKTNNTEVSLDQFAANALLKEAVEAITGSVKLGQEPATAADTLVAEKVKAEKLADKKFANVTLTAKKNQDNTNATITVTVPNATDTNNTATVTLANN